MNAQIAVLEQAALDLGPEVRVDQRYLCADALGVSNFPAMQRHRPIAEDQRHLPFAAVRAQLQGDPDGAGAPLDGLQLDPFLEIDLLADQEPERRLPER